MARHHSRIAKYTIIIKNRLIAAYRFANSKRYSSQLQLRIIPSTLIDIIGPFCLAHFAPRHSINTEIKWHKHKQQNTQYKEKKTERRCINKIFTNEYSIQFAFINSSSVSEMENPLVFHWCFWDGGWSHCAWILWRRCYESGIKYCEWKFNFKRIHSQFSNVDEGDVIPSIVAPVKINEWMTDQCANDNVDSTPTTYIIVVHIQCSGEWWLCEKLSNIFLNIYVFIRINRYILFMICLVGAQSLSVMWPTTKALWSTGWCKKHIARGAINRIALFMKCDVEANRIPGANDGYAWCRDAKSTCKSAMSHQAHNFHRICLRRPNE